MEFIQKLIWSSSKLLALYAIRFKSSLSGSSLFTLFKHIIVLVRQAFPREADLHYEHRSSQESWNQKVIQCNQGQSSFIKLTVFVVLLIKLKFQQEAVIRLLPVKYPPQPFQALDKQHKLFNVTKFVCTVCTSFFYGFNQKVKILNLLHLWLHNYYFLSKFNCTLSCLLTENKRS